MPSVSGVAGLPLNTSAPSSTGVAGSQALGATLPTGGSSGLSLAGSQLDTGPLLQVLQLMLTLLSSLVGGGGGIGISGGAGGIGCASCGSPGCPGCAVPLGAQVQPSQPVLTQAQPTARAQIRGVNDAQLQRNLDLIKSDPEGRRLIEEAERLGISVAIGNTGDRNVLGQFDPRNNTILVQDANNIKTIVHELVHATTEGDGNSQQEEGLANVVGRRIESRLTGRPLEDPQRTFANTIPNYPQLRANNNIVASLQALGIVA